MAKIKMNPCSNMNGLRTTISFPHSTPWNGSFVGDSMHTLQQRLKTLPSKTSLIEKVSFPQVHSQCLPSPPPVGSPIARRTCNNELFEHQSRPSHSVTASSWLLIFPKHLIIRWPTFFRCLRPSNRPFPPSSLIIYHTLNDGWETRCLLKEILNPVCNLLGEGDTVEEVEKMERPSQRKRGFTFTTPGFVEGNKLSSIPSHFAVFSFFDLLFFSLWKLGLVNQHHLYAIFIH